MTGGSQIPCDSLLDYCPWQSWKWGVETSSEDGGSQGGGGGTGVGGLCPGGSWPSPPTLEPRGLSFVGLVGLVGPSCIYLSFPTLGAGSLQPRAGGMRPDDGKPGKLGDTVMTRTGGPGLAIWTSGLTSGMTFKCPSEKGWARFGQNTALGNTLGLCWELLGWSWGAGAGALYRGSSQP